MKPQIKVLSIFGTRPEAIKMGCLVNELHKSEQFDSKVCVTGQHREMLDQVLDIFQINPDVDLNLMAAGQTLSGTTGRILDGLGPVLADYNPDLVLVHGDTTTTMAASLACLYAQVPVGHVEAGLRTGDIYAPWPEEANRRIVSPLATLHFAPTPQAKTNLIKENICSSSIFVTGNTVIDALFHTTEKLRNGELSIEPLPIAQDEQRRIILVTGHRRENFGDGFHRICEALANIAQRPDVLIVYPVHLNPEASRPVRGKLGGFENVLLLPPMDYANFAAMMAQSAIILTDSGGIQEEAPSLGKPVLVMRETTERPEAVVAGTVRLVGTDVEKITCAVNELLDNVASYEAMSRSHNPYGDGKAAKRIVEAIEGWWAVRNKT